MHNGELGSMSVLWLSYVTLRSLCYVRHVTLRYFTYVTLRSLRYVCYVTFVTLRSLRYVTFLAELGVFLAISRSLFPLKCSLNKGLN